MKKTTITIRDVPNMKVRNVVADALTAAGIRFDIGHDTRTFDTEIVIRDD